MTAAGILPGLAYGDALGCPIETWSAVQIRSIYGVYQGLPEQHPMQEIRQQFPQQLRRLRPLGIHSDDTQQAMALINVCREGFTPERWSRWLIEGLRSGAFRGYGRHFSAAVHALRKGKDFRSSGSPSAGMGAAMRVAPLAALYSTPEELSEVVVASSLMTHAHGVAAFTAYAVAACAFGFLQGLGVAEVQQKLPIWVRNAEEIWLSRPDWSFDRTDGHLVSDTLQAAFRQNFRDHKSLGDWISETAKPHLADDFTRAHPNQGYGLLGGLHGILMALQPQDPLDLLDEIVRLGFDTDTVAAIAGGILGARHGAGWIPMQKLLDRDRILAYAEGNTEDLSTYLKAEIAWTEKEKAFQQAL
ncbi:ADP-ribosylglycohydrolase family protein [Deinococcus roseus]|uniref:ADP-ribosylglycohydrolase n=1 Tax=Deinococcus roseus TaxID=392414 RepID=A0ABQ2CXT1_9DEIO|nr:ADP-ribosylglycohydrolase family protein [Deinococcus roseus]GGJ31560.1 hypothetical protein GCM10008938_17170 [Deinococcus roseus]